MQVRELYSEEETRAVYPVMRQLRSSLSEDGFVTSVGRMRGEGYRLAAVFDDETPVGVAGFRVFEMLYIGKALYVDDLVTLEDARSGGVGARMLEWLEDRAREAGCAYLHLDSGVQRSDAHRFYFRERMSIASYHFVKEL